MTRRVLLTELRRGTAPMALASMTAVGVVLLLNDTEVWAGRWNGLAGFLRTTFLVLVPIAVAAGAWQAGRERRRRIGDLIAAGSRPTMQRVVMSWAAVTVGTVTGVLLAWAVGAALVAPVATYAGGGWWWTLIVGLVGLGASTAVGFGVGHLLPWRITAPVAGLLTAVVGGVMVSGDDGASWLLPVILGGGPGRTLPLSFQALQALWFGALAAGVLGLIGARRRWIAAVSAGVAVIAAVPIVTGAGYERWHDDPAALEPVCAEGVPEVCVSRESAFLLDAFTPVAREFIARWDGVAGAPERVVEAVYDQPDEDLPSGTIDVSLRHYASWRGTLSLTAEYHRSVRAELAGAAVGEHRCDASFENSDGEVIDVGEVALVWAGGNPYAGGRYYQDGVEFVPEVDNDLYDRLATLSEAEQKDWIGRYLQESRHCDRQALYALGEELR